MKYLLLVTGILVFGNLQGQTSSVAHKQITIFFDVDKSAIDSTQKHRLRSFTRKLANENIQSIYMEGHTDSRSSRAYNEQLSARRVQRVRTCFTEFGFADSLFTTSWHGEVLPAQPNTSEDNMRSNRRVLVTVSYIKAEKVNLHQLFEGLVPETIVKWDAKSDTTVYGPEGSILHFPKGALKPCERCEYEIRIREIYDPGAMYLASLTTTSFQHFLRSDGMLEVRAYRNGELVTEAPLKPFSVLMPTDSLDSEMKLFYGAKTSAGIVNWHSPRPVNTISNSAISGNEISMTNLEGMEINRYEVIRWYLKRLFTRDVREKVKSSGNIEDDVSGYRERQGQVPKPRGMTPAQVAELNLNRANVDYYSFQSTKWGYMNMDAYMKLPPNERVNMKVLTDVSGNKAIKAMFTGRMSLLPEKLVKDGFVFESLPIDQNITLVATEVKNGYAYLAVKHVVADREYEDDFEYERYELKDLRQALNRKLVWTPLNLSSASSPQ